VSLSLLTVVATFVTAKGRKEIAPRRSRALASRVAIDHATRSNRSVAAREPQRSSLRESMTTNTDISSDR
jgi:hypothetical protein